MSKVRCKVCKKYIDKDSAISISVLSKVCSQDCVEQYRFKSRSKKPLKRPPMGVVTRETVMLRDGYRCRYCGKTENLHVHHIVYRSSGGTDDEQNLITLCLDHHALVHTNKKKYLPVLQEVISTTYSGRKLTVLQVEKRMAGEW